MAADESTPPASGQEVAEGPPSPGHKCGKEVHCAARKKTVSFDLPPPPTPPSQPPSAPSGPELVHEVVAALREDVGGEHGLGDAASQTRNLAVSRAARTLRELLKADKECMKLAVKVGAIDAVVIALRTRPNSEAVQNEATSSLGHLVQDSYENQTLAGQAGGIGVVISALREHPNSEAVQEHAADALGHLVMHEHEENQLLARLEGGIEAIIIALEHHRSSEALQWKASSALGKIVMGNGKNQKRARKANGIGAVLAALRAHPESARVQERAAETLEHLVAGSLESQVLAKEAGALGEVVAVLGRFRDREALQTIALGTLGKLVVDNAENQRLAGEAGCMEAVLSALQAFPDSEAVQRHACKTLGHLVSNNKANQALSREQGLVEAVIQTSLERHAASEAVQATALEALGKLLAGNGESQRRAGQAKGIEVTIAGLRGHPDSEAVREHASKVLGHLAMCQENRPLAREAGAMDAMILVFRQQSTGQAGEAKASGGRHALRALRNLVVGSRENTKAAVEAGGIEELVKALQRYPESDEEDESAAAALSQSEYQRLAREAGLIEALISVLKQPPKKSRNKGILGRTLSLPQATVLRVLQAIFDGSHENQTVAGEADALAAVISTLKDYANNEEVQEVASKVLLSLIVDNAANQRRAKEADADRHLLAARSLHPQSVPVLEAVSGALKWLRSGERENFVTWQLATEFGKRFKTYAPIADTAMRGVTLRQMLDLAEFIQESLARYDVQEFDEGQGVSSSLVWDKLTMYQVNTNFIQPLTKANSCSYVEAVCQGRQPPMWMLSHWWGTPFPFTVKMVQFQAQSRYLNGADAVTYWCCTMANNQHNLDELDEADVLKSPFARAMLSQSCMGTVLLCDPEATPLLRIWCVFEAHITQQLRCGVLSDRTDKKRYFLDIVAPVTHQDPAHEGEVEVSMTMLQDAVGGSWNEFSDHDRVFFPLDVARIGVSVDVCKAQSSMEEDRAAILNFLTQGVASKDPPPSSHPQYDELNTFVHTVFTSAELYRLASEQPEGCVEAAADLLRRRADVNNFLRQGNTPLFAAAGADPAVPGATDAAAQRGLLELLLTARADANHANAERKTVLDCSSALPEDARGLLLEYGAKTFADAAPDLERQANGLLQHIISSGFGSEWQAYVGGDAGTKLSVGAQRSLQAAAAAVLKLYHWAPCTISIQTGAKKHQTQLASERGSSIKLTLKSAGCKNDFTVAFGAQKALLRMSVSLSTMTPQEKPEPSTSCSPLKLVSKSRSPVKRQHSPDEHARRNSAMDPLPPVNVGEVRSQPGQLHPAACQGAGGGPWLRTSVEPRSSGGCHRAQPELEDRRGSRSRPQSGMPATDGVLASRRPQSGRYQAGFSGSSRYISLSPPAHNGRTVRHHTGVGALASAPTEATMFRTCSYSSGWGSSQAGDSAQSAGSGASPASSASEAHQVPSGSGGGWGAGSATRSIDTGQRSYSGYFYAAPGDGASQACPLSPPARSSNGWTARRPSMVARNSQATSSMRILQPNLAGSSGGRGLSPSASAPSLYSRGAVEPAAAGGPVAARTNSLPALNMSRSPMHYAHRPANRVFSVSDLIPEEC